MWGGRGSLVAVARSRNKAALAVRAGLILMAWLSFYTAARSLSLAQLTTIYFAAPIIVVALSAPILGERVTGPRWAAVLVGFAGVLLAANPSSGIDPVPAGMAFFAAVCWGLGSILVRMIIHRETAITQMLVSNTVFAVACAVALPWVWKSPDAFSLALMVGLGVAGGFGQYFVFQGFRYAPASIVAPLEYSGLVWAFLYGYLIWADVPHVNVFAGAILIVASSLGLIVVEGRRALRAV
jgi:S-adenosylmethionine uptake transporter